MPKRLASLAALLGTALLLLLVPAAASAAPSPWWQVLDGSRPTNMWEPADASEVQKLETSKFLGFVFAAKIEIGGEVVGCLGSGGFPLTPEILIPAEQFCQAETSHGADETAAELQTTLEAAYGGTVQVTGGPPGVAPMEVTTPGRWVEPLKLTVIKFQGVFDMGTAQTSVISKDSGRLVATVTNLGNAPVDATDTPVTIVDKLPEGVTAWGVEALAGVQGSAGDVDCSIEAPDEVICTFEETLPSYEAIEIEVFSVLTGSPPDAAAPGAAPGLITVSGGNAPTASSPQRIVASPEPTPFGLERFSAQSEEEGGGPTGQAGSHPYQFTTTLQLNAGPIVDPVRRKTAQPAMPRNVNVPLPPGFIGNVTATPSCEMADFYADPNNNFTNECPDETVIGVATVTFVETVNLGLVRMAVPVFNLTPGAGQPARFGFIPLRNPVVVDAAVDPDDGYRISAGPRNATQLVQFLSSTFTLWGTPGDPSHDSARGWACTSTDRISDVGPCNPPAVRDEDAFLRMPTSCNSPLHFSMRVEPWNTPLGSVFDEASSTSDPLVGCNKVPFNPTINAAPTSKLAESSTGLSFSLTMPNSGLLKGDAIAEGQPKKVEVTLPEGMTVNPSAAEGLAVCTPADYAREKFNSTPGAGCPDASKIGNVEIDTPLIEENPVGALYQAAPYENPSGSLLGLYIVARVPERGVLIKLDGKVEPDPKTGQLVTTFDDAPPLPFSSFDLNFREGGRAPLVTPPACGTYEVLARFIPWSAQDPDNPKPSEIVERKSTFTVQRGVEGGACPPGGVPPFDPGFEAGSLNNDAKSYSPFYMRLTRKDGEQNMTKFSSVLPPGVLGKLAGVGKCADAAIEAAKTRNGKDELATPSCPASSQIGRTSAGAGVGSVLTYVPGKLYLAGPYKGAPLSVVAITPGVAGPFDVGTIVVREALSLNPKTAEVEVDGAASDPIPHILQGIPLKVRDLRVYVDRENFILNPTSCDEESTKAILFGSFLDLFSSADDVAAQMQARYQAANCSNLGFKPRLDLKLTGGTRRGAHPGLRATYAPRPGDANLQDVVVRLPRSAFLDQAHIRTICTRVQFAAENCPKAAIYGYIKATTPLLAEPLQGPVYLRSSDHKLPDLVFDLQGIVDVEVSTKIDSVRGGIRASVHTAPDAPISKVLLTMQGGKKGLIVNSTNLCQGKNRAETSFTGHNGKASKARPVVKPVKCGKARKKRKSA
jgi:hypothetical protein